MGGRWVQVQGAPVYLVDAGRGTPTLFLHGNPDTGDVWRGVIARAKTRLRCLAPDLPGFGRSRCSPQFDPTVEGLARWVEDLVSALSIRGKLNLVVHDFGGPFGLAWACRNPGRVERLVILNTPFHPDYRWHFWGRVYRTPILGELAMKWTTRLALGLEMRHGSPTLTDRQIDDVFGRMSPAMKRSALRLYRANPPRAFAPWTPRLVEVAKKRPTLVLWGDRDPYIAPRFAGLFGAGKVKHFSEWGHWLQVEAPALVAREIMDFLSKRAAMKGRPG